MEITPSAHTLLQTAPLLARIQSDGSSQACVVISVPRRAAFSTAFAMTNAQTGGLPAPPVGRSNRNAPAISTAAREKRIAAGASDELLAIVLV